MEHPATLPQNPDKAKQYFLHIYVAHPENEISPLSFLSTFWYSLKSWNILVQLSFLRTCSNCSSVKPFLKICKFVMGFLQLLTVLRMICVYPRIGSLPNQSVMCFIATKPTSCCRAAARGLVAVTNRSSVLFYSSAI